MKSPAVLTVIQISLLVVLFVLNLFLGTVHIPISDICAILLGGGSDNEIWHNIVVNSRIPQALTAMVAHPARMEIRTGITVLRLPVSMGERVWGFWGINSGQAQPDTAPHIHRAPWTMLFQP